MSVLILAKAGYGSLAELEATPADLILDAIEYEGFLAEYTDTITELNKQETQ